jgi:predicted ATP-grasp superfamily ATP-dependent carboligase
MLHALLEDFSLVPAMRISTVMSTAASERFPLLEALNVEVIAVEASQESSAFRDLLRHSDAALIIAPEFDELLHQRCLWVEQVGLRLLGPSSKAARLAGDKLLLARHFENWSIPSPITVGLGVPPFTADMRWPAVCKPRLGAGSQATFLVRDPRELALCRARAEQEGWMGELLLQPFVPGLACSVGFLIGPDETVALPPCRQHLADDGRFHFLGGELPLPPDLAERAVALGRRAVASVPGLTGFVGVDLVLGTSPDGVDDAVIEINPRLTTSYVGMRALAEFNLAEAMLNVVQGRCLGNLKWRKGSVVYDCHGRVERRA